jgi:hypothetical protein
MRRSHQGALFLCPALTALLTQNQFGKAIPGLGRIIVKRIYIYLIINNIIIGI